MKRKYLKKVTVSARFITQILTQEQFKDETDQDYLESVWRTFLNAYANTKQISKYQAKTWKYPDKNKL